jgi:thiosulfate dehydrogenase [quinone] large subunit
MTLLQPLTALAVVRIAIGLYWLANAIRDFQLRRHKEMGFFLQMMARDNRLKWYGSFMNTAVIPYSGFFGYFVPVSMLLMGVSLIMGVWTSISLVGGIVLCLNVLLAFGFSKERPQLALLILSQLALLLSNAEGALHLHF